jgi:mannose-6-phosphate isomerase-like protein (cupin superfamily)
MGDERVAAPLNRALDQAAQVASVAVQVAKDEQTAHSSRAYRAAPARGSPPPNRSSRVVLDEMPEKVNLAQKLGLVNEHWQPKIVARINDNDVRIVKVKGKFVWHKHDDTDDLFLVLQGHLTIQLRDRDVELDEGELFVVPRGVEHCPRADEEASLLLIEPAGTINTGDAGGPMTTEAQSI